MKKKVKRQQLTANTPEELAELLGLHPSVAVEWELRHDITKRICKLAKESKVRVSHLAKAVGTSRARITKILKGEDIGISLDVLARVLGVLGEKVKVSFEKVD